MCGICGIIHEDPSRPVDRDLLARMNGTMRRRGPDDEGYYVGRGAALAMHRLAIIDLAGGHQPISSEDGSVWSVVNGEIYNYQSLKHELIAKGHTFRTRSDSEVLPHLYQAVGESFPERLNGMFGLAVWDERERALVLARDRMGQKPLYWCKARGSLIFGSELKAVLAYGMERRIDRCSLSKYLAHEYVPAPHTIFEGMRKLEPGQMLVWRDGNISIRSYWNVPLGDELCGIGEGEAAQELLRLLSQSVKRRLISDVPLGVFLSGGIDSSTIVAMMSRHMPPEEIKTFSIAFEERSFDESNYARRVARHFGTEHREQLCTPRDLLDLMPEVADILDEPFADASIIPTYALAKFTRRHVTVALGGDGGDELFAGYPTYQAERAARWYLGLPRALRHAIIEPMAGMIPASDENISFDFKVKQFLKGVERLDASRHIVWMGSFSDRELGGLLVDPPSCDIYRDAKRHALDAAPGKGGNDVLYGYMKMYLAEDILTKVDRASMGVSLEARAPFLDHEVVEFVARLPYRMKLRGFTMKHLLKRAVRDILPRGIAGRAKKGFGVPVAKWIKGPLKGMTQDLLSEGRLARDGIFQPAAVGRLLADHLAGRANNRKKLWTLIMFQKWLDRWGRG